MKTEFSAYTDSDAVTVFTPAAAATVDSATSGVRAEGSYLTDIVSAASVDIVSTASRRWTEVRHAATLGAEYRPSDVSVGATAAASSEPDYLSVNGGVRLGLDLAKKMVNPSFGYTFGHDTAGKTGTPFSVYSQELERHALTAGTELVLDRSTSAFVGLDVILERGDQKKPYRLLPMFDASTASHIDPGASLALVNTLRLPGRTGERTPGERARFAASFRLARRFSTSTLVLAERLYADDWGLVASTSDARFYPELTPQLVLLFHARAHAQTGVAFWSRAYVARVDGEGSVVVPSFRTGDRELGPLLSGTAGAGLRLTLRPFAVSLQGDVTMTRYLDTLYVRERLSTIGVLQLETDL